MQLQFIRRELGDAFLNTLKNASSVREASDTVLFQYERPANQSQEVQDKRADYAQRFFDMYGAPVYFRVRKTWEDKGSQLGAFRVYQNAKACADVNPGYAVFNESGEQVYPVVEPITETRTEREQDLSETDQNVIWVVIKSTDKEVVVRNGNGTEYSRITTIVPGTKLEFVASSINRWYALKIDNQVGWVSGECAQITTS